jgi:hypothetical protein
MKRNLKYTKRKWPVRLDARFEGWKEGKVGGRLIRNLYDGKVCASKSGTSKCKWGTERNW